MSLGMAAATVVGTALGAQLTKKARDASWCLGPAWFKLNLPLLGLGSAPLLTCSEISRLQLFGDKEDKDIDAHEFLLCVPRATD